MLKSIIFSIILLFLFSCNIIDPPENVPSYLSVKSIKLKDNESQNIIDAWVNVDDNLLGCFELPAKFPILSEGKHKITIRAGIKKNGIASTRALYPFYKSIDTTVTLTKSSVLELNEVITEYLPNVSKWEENFENAGTNFENTANSLATFEIVENGFISKLGAINLDNTKNVFEAKTTKNWTFENGEQIYLEMNYKNNNGFYVGAMVQSAGTEYRETIMYIKPSANWNKIYVNLNDILSYYTSADYFNVFIYADKEVESAQILLDNIRVVKWK